MSNLTSEDGQPTKLLDAKMIVNEYGLTQGTAYKLMHLLGPISLHQAGVKKLYLRREKLDLYLAENERGAE